MSNSISFTRAGMSAALYVVVMGGVSMATGSDFDLSGLAVDGGIVAASAIGADYAHAMLGMVPTRTTSAVATGAIFAAVQRFRGDDALLINFVGGAANDAWVDMLASAGY
jgi:hypothetical protein